MRTPVPRTKTPTKSDADAVEPSLTRDLTEPQVAPPTRSTPVGGTTVARAARKLKQTLVSPIPAILAESMSQIREERSGATPFTGAAHAKGAAELDAVDQDALLVDEDLDSDYVVEVIDTHK